MVIPKHQISTIKLDTRPKMPECTDHIYTLILYSISPGSRMPKCRENSPYLGTEVVPTPTPKCPQPPSQVGKGKTASVCRCARPGDARSATRPPPWTNAPSHCKIHNYHSVLSTNTSLYTKYKSTLCTQVKKYIKYKIHFVQTVFTEPLL